MFIIYIFWHIMQCYNAQTATDKQASGRFLASGPGVLNSYTDYRLWWFR